MNIGRYRDLFVSEAQEHLNLLGSLCLRCDKGQADDATIHELFRHAHSLKGMAATMQLTPISSLAHALEELLTRLRDGKLGISRNLTDLLLTAIDALEQQVTLVARQADLPDNAQLIEQLRSFTPAPETAAPTPQQPAPAAPSPPPAPPSFRSGDESATTRIRTVLLDRLVSLSGELLTVRHTLEEQATRHPVEGFTQPLRELSHLLRQLQQEIFQARMVPFGSIAERFPRMVRELARRSGKEVSFQISGEGIELDRGVLEQLVEPLMHILRNAVDHGIEPPAERIATGKPAEGQLRLQVHRQADRFLLTVSDDGRGMDPVRLCAKAVARGLLSRQQAAALSREEALLLVCTPGFSTADTVTEVSGRGVGMDVVRTAVQLLGGSLTIESTAGSGSIITLQLPVTVAIIHTLLVVCGELTLAVPVTALNGTLEVPRGRITPSGRDAMLLHHGTELPLRDLPAFFQQRSSLGQSSIVPVLLTESNRQPVGLMVDRILGQQELFIRPLCQPLAALRGITGSSVQGDGRIIFVIDPATCAAPQLNT